MQQPESAFRKHLSRLNNLIRDGGSLSGGERNCVFLNLGGKRFATVSAISGIDFPDDGRTPVVTDWDHDGDLDLWVANRTAPMLRYLQNNTDASSRSVMFRLQGTSINRDAIGARVELRWDDGDTPSQIKTLKAGEGFLGQSAKIVHFGLGESHGTPQVRVRWAKTDWEKFDIPDFAAGKEYLLIQGTGRASRIEYPRDHAPQVEARPQPVSVSSSAVDRIRFTGNIPAVRLPFRSISTTSEDPSPTLEIPFDGQNTVVVQLWASWCRACLEELKEWSTNADRIAAQSLRVYAISLDEVDDHAEASGREAEAALKRLSFPFQAGMADQDFLVRTEQLANWPFRRRIPLAIPTTLVFDPQGNLRLLYRGAVSRDTLMSDVKSMGSAPTPGDPGALPFPGHWHYSPRPLSPIAMAVELMDRGDAADAADFLKRNLELLFPHREFPLLSVWIGDAYAGQGDVATAITFYELALQKDPTNVTALNNLAWQLAANSRAENRDPARAVALAQRAIQAQSPPHPSLHDTLAVAFAALGNFDAAVKQLDAAIEIAAMNRDETRIAKLKSRRAMFAAGQPFVEPGPKLQSPTKE